MSSIVSTSRTGPSADQLTRASLSGASTTKIGLLGNQLDEERNSKIGPNLEFHLLAKAILVGEGRARWNLGGITQENRRAVDRARKDEQLRRSSVRKLSHLRRD